MRSVQQYNMFNRKIHAEQQNKQQNVSIKTTLLNIKHFQHFVRHNTLLTFILFYGNQFDTCNSMIYLHLNE